MIQFSLTYLSASFYFYAFNNRAMTLKHTFHTFTPIPAFQDNYIWLIDLGTEAVLVDPGEAEAALEYLQTQKLNLAGILITHHHADHCGGVEKLLSQFPCPVY